MELIRTNNFASGDIIAYYSRSNGKLVPNFAQITKVNSLSLRIRDGTITSGNFIPSRTTKNGSLTKKRRIFKYVGSDTVADIRTVTPLYNDSIPTQSTAPIEDVQSITIEHPRSGPIQNSFRIGYQKRILSTGGKAGKTGYTIKEVSNAIGNWYPDGRRHCAMKFSKIDSRKKLRFIRNDEDPDDLIPLVLGTEIWGDGRRIYGKAAFKRRSTNKIIFRTAMKGEHSRNEYQSHRTHWNVQTGMFNADESFWTELKQQTIFNSNNTTLVDYDSE